MGWKRCNRRRNAPRRLEQGTLSDEAKRLRGMTAQAGAPERRELDHAAH
jgi:hypothetical protein